MSPAFDGLRHLAALSTALDGLAADVARVERWGAHLAGVLTAGGRLLACGNGGSAAQAQHLTAELVGRYVDERPPFSALCLSAETSSLTAIGNDYGLDEVFARQVRAHGRPGDVLVALSTSGRSPNMVAAVDAAVDAGLTVWGVTGGGPNPVADRASDAVRLVAPGTPTVQEASLVVLHLLCAAFDAALPAVAGVGAATAAPPFAIDLRRP